MIPFLFSFQLAGHQFQIPSYGVMLAIGFTIGYIDALLKSKRVKADPKYVERLYILTVFGAMVGSRLFHVAFEQFDYYVEHPLKIFAVWEGGYTLYGGILFCLVTILVYCRAKKLSFLTYGDLAATSTAIGLFFGRVGCFLAGCCWGRSTTMPWGVQFNHPLTFCSVHGVSLHPSQLYEAIGALVIYAYLCWRLKRRSYSGQILLHGVALYSVLRFVIEFFRGDEIRGFVFDGFLSYSQLVSLCLIPLVVWGMRTRGEFSPLRIN